MVPASRGVRTPAGPPIVAVHPRLLPGPLYLDGSSGRWFSRGRPRPGADSTPGATPLVSFSPPRRLGQSSPQNRWHLRFQIMSPMHVGPPLFLLAFPGRGSSCAPPSPPLPSRQEVMPAATGCPPPPLLSLLLSAGGATVQSASPARRPALASEDFWSLPLWGGVPRPRGSVLVTPQSRRAALRCRGAAPVRRRGGVGLAGGTCPSPCRRRAAAAPDPV